MRQLKLLFAGVAAFTAGGADVAEAQRVRTAEPPATPMPAFSWTGCYLGVHGGWGRVDSTVNVRSVGFEGTNDLDSDGVLFGGQFRCDYQSLNGWVMGLQGDIAASSIDGRAFTPVYTGEAASDTQWLASITGRLGYSGLVPQTLLYLKAGAAWTRQAYDINIPGFTELSGAFNKTYSGWTVGGGVAWALTDRWSAFVEYNHYDFSGSLSTPSTGLGQVVTIGAPKIDTVKFGLDYRY